MMNKKENKNITSKLFNKINTNNFVNSNKARDKVKNLNFVDKLKNNIENELYIRYDYDENTNKKMTKDIILKIVGIDISVIVALFLIFVFNSYAFVIILFFINFINKEMINKFLDYEEEKILFQLPEFIDELKSSYYETKMVTESLENANLNSNYEIALRGKKMLKILESNNVDVELEKYNRETKNKFLKLLLNVMYLTKENGDVKEKGEKKESVFIKNLNYLLEEINIEILKQNLFKMKFQGLIIATIFPLFFINFVERWSVNNFELLSEFYNSYLGFVIKNLIIIVTVFMGILILKIRDSELSSHSRINFNNKKQNKKQNEKKYTNIKLKKAKEKVDKFIFNKKSKEYKKIISRLEEKYSDITPDDYIKTKIKILCFTNLFMIFMFISANKFIGEITFKIISVEFIVTIIISICMTLILDFNINFENKMKKMSARDEINNFRTIILLMIKYPFASCEEILKYIEKYSSFYKNQIRRCINDFENGAEYALMRLKNEIKEKEFKKIVRCLIQCSKNITPCEAFGFLESEREFYKDQTKNKNMQCVVEKTNLAQLISVMPYYTLVILYFVMPMIIVGIKEISALIEELSIINL